jgi:uncharacterized membrane protein YdbT with pleckstrin-like domain
MGRYIDEILQPDEKLLFSASTHWIVLVPGLVALAASLAFFVMSRGVENDGAVVLWLSLAVVCAMAGLYGFAKGWFRRWTTETDVTNLRIVHKEGFIKRRTFEMNLDKVESVDVEQTIGGRLLGYGNVTILGVGEGRETIQLIASPLQFRNHITARG